MIADAFDLPPLFLGLEHDVNRSTAAELNDVAFRQAIVPTARLFAEHLTRDAIGKKLGWSDLEFVFTDVDAQQRDANEAADPGNPAALRRADGERSAADADCRREASAEVNVRGRAHDTSS